MTTLIRIGRRLAAPDGFTLIELIVVLGVISAIAMVAVAR
jgi:prepilin-type N-terminal cleavage/methylation domain-containing protein